MSDPTTFPTCPRLPWGYWTPERVLWLTDAYRQTPYPGVTDTYNAHWAPQDGFRLLPHQVKAAISNYHIHCGRVGMSSQHPTWTPDQLDWLRATRADQSLADLTAAFNRYWRTARTEGALTATCQRYGITGTRDTRFQPGQDAWNQGRDGWSPGGASVTSRFQPGQISSNALPIGSVKRNGQGYWVIKISHGATSHRGHSPDNWLFCQRDLWQQHHGPIPAGHNILFLDGDRDHIDIDNLICLPRKVCGEWQRQIRVANATTLDERLLALDRARLKIRAYQLARDRLKLSLHATRALFHGQHGQHGQPAPGPDDHG